MLHKKNEAQSSLFKEKYFYNTLHLNSTWDLAMDLYSKNPTIIKRLLAKRQNPSIQLTNPQSSSLPNRSVNNLNFKQKANLFSIPTTTASNLINKSSHQIHYNTNTVIIVTSKDTCNSFTEQSKNSENETAGDEDIGSNDLSGDREPQKKKKLNHEIKEKRKISFDDEIDASTTCETASDGNTNEYSDYYSPSFGYQTNKYNRFEEFKLDEEDNGSYNQSFRPDAIPEDLFYIKEGYEIALKFEGKCLSLKCGDDKAPLKLMYSTYIYLLILLN